MHELGWGGTAGAEEERRPSDVGDSQEKQHLRERHLQQHRGTKM